MIDIRKVEVDDYNNLENMYYDYYQSVFGKDWIDAIPVERIRNLLSANKHQAQVATKKAFSDELPAGMIDRRVLGLYLNRELIGFACVAIFRDNVGGVYHIYVKPEYRKTFIANFSQKDYAVKHLIHGIEAYFYESDVNSVELEVPHTLNSVKRCVEKVGFKPKKDYYDATYYKKTR